MTSSLHVGDIGSYIELTIKDEDVVFDISSATVKKIKLKTSANVVLDKTASFSTNGTDGKIRYTFINGDLNISGIWKARAYIEMPSGKWSTSQIEFEVLPTF